VRNVLVVSGIDRLVAEQAYGLEFVGRQPRPIRFQKRT
jgi:hypothetical protein